MDAIHPNTEIKATYARAFQLAILTVIVSSLEGSFSIYFGYHSKSLTLFGNGVACFIAVVSAIGIVVMTRMIAQGSHKDPFRFERIALRTTGTGLYILSVVLVIAGVANIIRGEHPENTVSGIIIAAITILVVGILTTAKFRLATRLGSKALRSDAKSTAITIAMSTMVLIASLIFELAKFEYADAIGAVGLAYFAFREARECLKVT